MLPGFTTLLPLIKVSTGWPTSFGGVAVEQRLFKASADGGFATALGKVAKITY